MTTTDPAGQALPPTANPGSPTGCPVHAGTSSRSESSTIPRPPDRAGRPMSRATDSGATPFPPAPPTAAAPAHAPTPLYSQRFAADPATVYRELRDQGPTALVELSPGVPATLVTGYEAALAVLRDPESFPRDPRRWQQTVPSDCPVLPMLMYRHSAVFNDGAEHERLRATITDGLSRIEPTTLREYVERSADTLLDDIAERGEADLLAEYARLLPILVFNQLLNCPPQLSGQLVRSLASMFEGGPDAAQANNELGHCTLELIALRKENPGSDLLSWLIAHPAQLTTEELAHQIPLLLAAGIEPVQNLIANVLRLLLSDDRFAGDLSNGSLPVEDALVEILWTDPPMANYAASHPTRDVELPDGTVIPAGRPVLISFAAANTDPTTSIEHGVGNRAHLAWSAGPHACPGQSPARIIASLAIEKVLDRLPDLELVVPAEDLTWRPGPFHRALTALPVRFPPVVEQPEAPDAGRGDGSPWRRTSVPTPAGPGMAPAGTREPWLSDSNAPRWLNSLRRWWRGQ
ncbi:cytochrome P450 [Actinoalloteichus hymeniacidonis]|uniref:Cytochrome P450 n=1 Tax=Actinoalloteichus hymeniacidonis TaxID=340345 RepID=A0AAC9HRU3_9PSEU|nr:cytochrome P450 [Actinoalloteichus hymeniacidonis]AOS64223.1 cytochrome P450 [Actinoalloteichus hymeniacidonis]MBB5907709.1 cytochrome P450 [Actinoalloteichus hymeniacidonis]